MSELTFTGERLHEDSDLFQADLVRHRVAYSHAIAEARRLSASRVLEIGFGTGYGANQLAEAGLDVFAVDRVHPLPGARHARIRFARADAGRIPLADDCFDLVLSFQVIEHLDDPRDYLAAMAALTRSNGTTLITTPNLAQSDRENPFHVHEYGVDELKALLETFFENVEMLGVGATGAAWDYHERRLARIRRITRLDPLRIRRILPRSAIEWLFGAFAVIVRRGITQTDAVPTVSAEQHPIGPADARCLDLLAVCRGPRRGLS